ncbi:sulfotransferase family protein [Methylotetracoccus oryzae]|uniref:sulfotransferase family protein n=1 Tax=Methylotetracoccus oryzae TaxID=1919059 RepID=UPI00111AE7CA|nr:sulfotransferase [Methylotetracoccus oryzae]
MGEYESNLQSAVECANVGDHESAITYYLKAIERRWWCHHALMGLAGSYTWLGRFREAIQVFIRSAACFPQELPDYFVLKNRVRTHILGSKDMALLNYMIHALWVINRTLKYNFYASDFLSDMLMLKGDVGNALEKKYYASICHAAFTKAEDLSRFHRSTGKLPDFFVIGPQKTATTALYAFLTRSPSIYPAINKELFFFNGPMFKYGEEWYRCNFPAPVDGSSFLTGEATATYFHSPVAPARIRAMVPDAKLIVTLRDPAERAISSFYMEKRQGREPRGLFEAMSAEIEFIESNELPPGGHPKGMFARDRVGQGGYVLFSFYEHFLRSYRKMFPEDRLLVVNAEELRDSAACGDRILRFLGAEPPEGGDRDAVSTRNVGEYERGDEYMKTLALLREYFEAKRAYVSG